MDARKIEPVDILHSAAVVADEMVMPFQIGVVAGGFAIQREFTDQARLNQRMKTVVNGGAGSQRLLGIQRRP